MIVVDSSAWIELLRATESRVCQALERFLEEGRQLAVTEVVVMELLAGASSESQAAALKGRILAYPVLPLRSVAGYQAAAALYRACRRGGETLRKMTDCLVAVPTIDASATLLHADADFDVLARHTALRIEPVG